MARSRSGGQRTFADHTSQLEGYHINWSRVHLNEVIFLRDFILEIAPAMMDMVGTLRTYLNRRYPRSEMGDLFENYSRVVLIRVQSTITEILQSNHVQLNHDHYRNSQVPEDDIDEIAHRGSFLDLLQLAGVEQEEEDNSVFWTLPNIEEVQQGPSWLHGGATLQMFSADEGAKFLQNNL